jgi:hypothetical protein
MIRHEKEKVRPPKLLLLAVRDGLEDLRRAIGTSEMILVPRLATEG